MAALNRGQFKQALSQCSRLIAHCPDFADGWFLRAMAGAGCGDIHTALADAAQALSLQGNNAEYLAQFAKLNVLDNQFNAAKHAAYQALEQQPKQGLTLDTLGVVLSKLGDYTTAAKALQQAVNAAPNNPQFRFNLASAQQFLGKQAAAQQEYLAAIALRPNFARAYWALSELNKTEPEARYLEQLQQQLKRPNLTPTDQLYLCHALAREREKQQDYDSAFNLLQRGKQAFKARINYSSSQDAALFAAIIQAFAEPPTPTANNRRGAEAIFVVGMPRSGTTLVDRALSSHSEVESLGELQNFALEVKKQANSPGRQVIDPQLFSRAAHINSEALAEAYLGSLVNRSSQKKRFIDKTPLNFLHLGFILKALPAAKIVLVKRHPLDTCLSNFRQLFALGFSYYNYHYDILDTGRYYCLFEQLSRHWLTVFQHNIHVVQYERLVAEPADSIAELLKFCELPWQAQCLAFHKNPEAVATASAMQVRQPIYHSAVNRWSHYATQLQPLINLLKSEGITF